MLLSREQNEVTKKDLKWEKRSVESRARGESDSSYCSHVQKASQNVCCACVYSHFELGEKKVSLDNG